MPRRIKPIKHTPFQMRTPEKGKTRYENERLAREAAARQMLLHSQLELRVYKGLDGGWYLTRDISKE